MKSKVLVFLGLWAATMLRGVSAVELAPLESYGNLPVISSMALSPGGGRIAYRHEEGNKDFVFVTDIKTGKIIGGADVAAVKPREIYFLDDDTVLLLVSNTMRERFGRKAFENSAAFTLDVSSNHIRRLLRGAKGLYSAQTGLGRVVGRSSDCNYRV